MQQQSGRVKAIPASVENLMKNGEVHVVTFFFFFLEVFGFTLSFNWDVHTDLFLFFFF